VGFDDIVDGRYAVPSLTTVAPDKEQLARLALDCLADRIADPGRPDRDLVAGHRLLVRESTTGGIGYRTAGVDAPVITEQKPTGSHS
jgi:DNA-binding LacI/PurR family transcriptional regulator